jgi:phosphoglycolate phosphatase
MAGGLVTLFLFDIDGTLVTTGGAGRTSMKLAAQRLFGVPDLFAGRSFAGVVDNGIVASALDAVGIAPTPRRMGRFRATYGRILKRRIEKHPGRVMPGVRPLLDALHGRSMLGLQTGNWVLGAQTKLANFGLWEPYFGALGAFGCDAVLRDDLLPFALRRARRRGWDGRRVVVIGDTPGDIDCSRAGLATLRTPRPELVCVGVLTGFAAADDVRASKPDLLLNDLESGQDAVLALV